MTMAEKCARSGYYEYMPTDCENCKGKDKDSDFCKHKRHMDDVKTAESIRMKRMTEWNAGC